MAASIAFPPSSFFIKSSTISFSKEQRSTGRITAKGRFGFKFTTVCAASDPQQLKQARQDIIQLLKATHCNPILEIVALSGAHTLGRARPERSGWGKPATKYTKDGPGAPGGQSWTVEWLKFDNFYFKDIKEKRDEDLLVLPTDAVLFEDPGFKEYAETYAVDQDTFFRDYAEAHSKLSNLGAKFDPPEGFSINDAVQEPQPEKFVAAKYSSGKNEKDDLSEAMKAKMRAEYLALGGSPNKPLQSNYFLNIIIFVSVLAILSYFFGGTGGDQF
eukprot:TRINITY_DN2034_c0_g1_i5.p1 TRINITY_DN2034_c0_g1~~TRINITY_DN2034_c0_g1_i5.p1  ORF type:complete len:319 (-),score=64.12 TRINITY_DN2034_c0_g1_i5:279-1097(-)